jgi:hypothetical protein
MSKQTGEMEKKRWVHDIGVFRGQCKGVVECFVVRPNDPKLLAGLLTFDSKVLRLVAVADTLFQMIGNPALWPKAKPLLCLTCDHEFGPHQPLPAAVMVQAPWGSNWEQDASMMIATGVCKQCAATKTDENLCEIVIGFWKGRVLQMGSA